MKSPAEAVRQSVTHLRKQPLQLSEDVGQEGACLLGFRNSFAQVVVKRLEHGSQLVELLVGHSVFLTCLRKGFSGKPSQGRARPAPGLSAITDARSAR